MKHRLNRRDFLKIVGAIPLSIAAPRVMRSLGIPRSINGQKRNVLVVVFDALSAAHVSTYGYERETTPNLAKLSERAVVYHNHYAGGSFTTPGTASLLTGTLPWTHRAFQPKAKVTSPYVTRNFFSAFQDYYRIAYTHNSWANILLEQCVNEMNELVPWTSLLLQAVGKVLESLFKKDSDVASIGWTRTINIKNGYAYSLFFSHLYEAIQKNRAADLEAQFPRGLPTTGFVDGEFLLENAIDWVGKRLPAIPQPFMGYFHFFPPHEPYNTSREFYNKFKNDGFDPVEKPNTAFSISRTREDLLRQRAAYDEFILYADKEFGRLFNYLEESGLLENTWVVFTSDHGELFERGIRGHSTNGLYEALIKVPLLIFEPGRKTRLDIHTRTCAIDLLPTLSYVTEQKIPDWTEGTLMPPYAPDNQDTNRNIYVVQARENEQNARLEKTTLVMIKGKYKLIYSLHDLEISEIGLSEYAQLFDIEADPEELNDLYSSRSDLATQMLNELKTKLSDVNKSYSKS
jgi:arylsulfatase A-like enzyme